MYLYKTKKVDGLTESDYKRIDNIIQDLEINSNSLNNIDLEGPTGIPNANDLISSIKIQGSYIHWYSIFDQVGYWRKANSIHNWFVKNVQGGIDECQLAIVTKEQLQQLLRETKQVLSNKRLAKKLLPTTGGFFFGSTDFDENYIDDMNFTVKILEKVLSETDFDKEVVFYRSSW